MVKPDGNMRDHYNFDEYGKPAPGNSKLSPDGAINLHNTFGYTGEMWDEEDNLLYLRARYYEPETGRFLSRDTYEGIASEPLSLNRYTYVANNPLKYADPSGNIPIKVGNTYLPSYLKNGKIMVSAERLAYALHYSVQHKRNGNYVVWMRNGKGYEYTAPNHGLFDLLNQWGILTSGVIPLHGSDYSVWGMYCHYRRDGKGEKLEKYGVVAVAAGGTPIMISWAAEILAPFAATQADKFAAAQVLKMDAEALFTRYESHIFSSDHLAKGIMDLGPSRQAIYNSMVNTVKGTQGMAVEGSNEIRMILNGYQATIRFNVQNGVVQSINGFKGFSDRVIGNLIDLT